MHVKTLTALAAAVDASSAFARTQPPEPDYTFAFNVGVNTDCRFRSTTQTRVDPSVFGGIDFAHISGFYLGTWASNIQWIKDSVGNNSDAEIDIYGGYKGSVSDIAYDLGVLGYLYPDHRGYSPNPETTELYGALTYGPVTAKYSHAVSNAFGFADSHNSGYLDLSATFDLGRGWSVVPHVGHQRFAGSSGGVSNSQFSYTDYALTLNYELGNGLVASVAGIGTNARKAAYTVGPFASSSVGRYTGNDTMVLGLKYNF